MSATQDTPGGLRDPWGDTIHEKFLWSRIAQKSFLHKEKKSDFLHPLTPPPRK